MSEEAHKQADQQADVIKERIEGLKLEIVHTGYMLAKTGDDVHRRKLAEQVEVLDLLTVAEKHRPSMYGFLKSLGG